MSGNQIRTASPGRLVSLLLDQLQPIVLLGAGASITSGIPAAGTTVELIAKWAWCKEHVRHFDDPSVRRSDWWPWLSAHPWYRTDVSLADLYPTAVENLLGVKRDRRAFFQYLIEPIDVPPSVGYAALAEILHNKWVSTVLTTNFDDRLKRAAILANRPHRLVEVSTPDDYILLSSSPVDPQVVYLHGSVAHYTDKNLSEEVSSLDPNLVARLKPLIQDHPIIVVGYRGTEASVMRDLFLAQAESGGCLQGVYWCVLEKEIDTPRSPWLDKFATAIGTNFNFVPIDSFDDLLDRQVLKAIQVHNLAPRPIQAGNTAKGQPSDMRPVEGLVMKDLERALLSTRIGQYAKRTGQWTPDPVDDAWVDAMAGGLDLARLIDGSLVPTLAGLLLFSREPTLRCPQARIEFEAIGATDWLRGRFGSDIEVEKSAAGGESVVRRDIRGHLWAQLDAVTDLLSLVNFQFRLKEDVSKDVNAYHPIAIKEAVVNAVVHRDYGSDEPIRIRVTARSIEVISPGGLVEDIASQVGSQSFQDAIANRRSPIKGYRNPVISDLFYGGGQMDRRGSGLPDIIRLTANNNGGVSFGPSADNMRFVVRVDARPEAVNALTNTAVPEDGERVRYTTNLLAMEQLPTMVWHAGTAADSNRTFYREAAGLSVPSGSVHDHRFFSLYDLEQMAEAMATPFDRGDIETMTFKELVESPGGESIALKLLHDLVFGHLRRKGLLIERERRRAYFPKEEGELERKVNYQARVRRATRTVVKARTKRDSDEVIYYEHKAVSFSLMRFGQAWTIVLNPGYVFTRDGVSKFLGTDKTNSLSTRRAARDFNQTVMQDIAFWVAVLSGGTDGIFALEFREDNSFTAFAPVVLLSSKPPAVAVNASAFGKSGVDQDLDEDMRLLDEELQALAGEGFDAPAIEEDGEESGDDN
jgi:NAD-dependent SIR2 family protein deacetylase